MPTQHHYISNTLAKNPQYDINSNNKTTAVQASVHKEQTHSLFQTRNHHTKIISEKPQNQFQ